MPEFHAPKVHDLGGFTVERVLPNARRRSVGPFVFFDHIGPALLDGPQPVAVRPHPHIGLATVTYLWEGAMMHRDSLGSVQEINPGDVNWMTAGRGIVHSERTPERLRGVPHRFHGLQTWIALPASHEEVAPAFSHHPKALLPVVAVDGVEMTVVAGRAFGEHSPVAVYSDTLYVSLEFEAGAGVRLPAEHAERALFPVQGELSLDGLPLPLNTLVVLDPGSTPMLQARSAARVMLLGGEPLDGPRFVWWNFVSSSRERIERAKRDWSGGAFDAVPGETEFIPLPEER
jgi:redox-sensitive bicupin YhaK (pirin superfamily)